MWNKLEEFRNELADNGRSLTFAAGSVAILSMAATAGYVIWSIKGGYLLASMLSQIPAWRFIDPLPVIDTTWERDQIQKKAADEDPKDKVEQIVS